MASAQNEVIKKFMASLDKTTLTGAAALDEAIKACSNFNGIQDAIDHMIEDCQNSPNGEYFLRKYCGINLYNDDTGAITGSDAGGPVVKNADDIVPEKGEAKYPESTTFTIRGLTVVVPEKNTLTKAEQNVVKGLYSWWIEEALKLIEESYGFSFTDSDKSGNTLNVVFSYDPYATFLAAAGGSSLEINMYYYKSIVENEVNGKPEYRDGLQYLDGFYLDRIISHELTHSIMDIAISNFRELPEFIIEGMAELTHGADDDRKLNIQFLSGNPSQLKEIPNDNNLSIGGAPSYAGGFMFLRYLARQGAGVIGNEEDYKRYEIKSSDKPFDVFDDGLTLISSKSDNFIRNDKHKSIIEYASGSGNDTIYGVENATIKITDGSIDDYEQDGDDMILKINEGSIRLIGAINPYVSSTVKLIDSKNNPIDLNNFLPLHIYNADYNDTLISGYNANDVIISRGSNSTIDAGKGNDNIDISYGQNILVYAGDGNDIINTDGEDYTVYGGNGNDTINLKGGSTTVVYSEGDGDDVIDFYDYQKFALKIKLQSGNIDEYFIDVFDVVFKVGEGSIRVKNALGQQITIEDANGNVSTETYGTRPNVFTNYDWDNPSIKGTDDVDFITSHVLRDSIIAGDGDDVIYIKNFYSTVNPGKGNDIIYFDMSNQAVIEYADGDGNDTIYGFDYDSRQLKLTDGAIVTGSTIDSGDLFLQVNDNILTFKDIKNLDFEIINIDGSSSYFYNYNDVSKNIINLGDSGNYYYNSVKIVDVIINGGAGNDTIHSDNELTAIFGGAGNDFIENNGDAKAIHGDDGDDTICNYRSNVTINGGAGNDSICNYGNNSPVNGGIGDDTICAYGYVEYVAGEGNDVITKYDTLKILGGKIDGFKIDDYDLLLNVGSNTLRILGGAFVPLRLGNENDEISYHYFAKPKNFSGLQNRIITHANIYFHSETDFSNYGDYSSLHLSDFGGYLYNYSKYSSIYGGLGSDYIYNAHATADLKKNEDFFSADYSFIDAGAGDDYICNDCDNITIHSGEGNDTIFNYQYYKSHDDGTSTPIDNLHVTIDSGGGNDQIYNANAEAIINAGSGEDSIHNVGDRSVILTGSGNDTIFNEAQNVTINGGTGDDFITYSNYTKYIQYANGDGNDIIEGLSDYDTIHITSGSYDGFSIDNDSSDAILKVGSGSIRLKYAVGKSFTLIESNGRVTNTTLDMPVQDTGSNGGGGSSSSGGGGTSSSGGGGTSSSSGGGSSSSGGGGTSSSSGGTSSSSGGGTSSSGGGGTSSSSGGGTSSSSGGGTSSSSGGGTSSSSGGGTSSSSGGGTSSSSGGGTSSSGGGGTSSSGGGTSSSSGGGTSSSSGGGTSSSSGGGTSSSGGGGTSSSGGGGTSSSSGGGSLSSSGGGTSSSSGGGTSSSGDDSNSPSSITDSTPSTPETIDNTPTTPETIDSTPTTPETIDSTPTTPETIDSTPSTPVTIDNTPTTSTETIDNTPTTPVTIDNKPTTSTETIDNKPTTSTETIDNKPTTSTETIDNTPTTPVTIDSTPTSTESIDSTPTIPVVVDPTVPATIDTDSSIPAFTYNASKTTVILSSSFSGQFDNYAAKVKTIDASEVADNISIVGNKLANSIKGSEYNDTISGGKGNDTLTGGAGDNVFIYSSGDGKDIITDFSDNDKIKIASGTLNKSSIKGNDVVLKIGSGSITLKKAINKNITIIDKNNNSSTLIHGTKKKDKISGTSQNDTIIGNAGNDTLTGGKGADTFAYKSGDGNDVITDYTSKQDKIKILSGSISSSSLKGKDVILKFAKGSINIKNAKNKNISIIDSKNKAINLIVGGNTKDKLTGIAGADSIIGNAGDDTLTGGKGNDTLAGGKGKDVFVYSNGDGNDVIADFTSGQDRIKINAGSISKASLSGNDVVLKIGKGSIKVKNAKGKALTIVNSKNISSTVTYTDTLMLNNSNANSVTVTDSLTKTIDASKRTKSIKIIGNSNANTIYSGKGNDTLSGGNGNDTFVYSTGSGNDVITDYNVDQDKIKIASGSIDKTSLNGSDVVLKVGKGSIKVKNGKNKLISTISSTNKTTNVMLGGKGKNTLKGGSAADSIVGNAGADTINGGKGNDTLTGGKGADVFVYKSGDGNDVITDYSAQDKISITGGTYTRSTVGNDVKIKVGSGSILLKNAKGKSITINNKRNFEEHWFLDNAECGMQSDELGSIVDSKSEIAVDYKYNDDCKTTTYTNTWSDEFGNKNKRL